MGKEEQPLVTTVIPVYLAEHYLRRCVDSVLSQTYQDLQIILVDDGSPDGSPQICDEYAKCDERILVIHKKNGGVSSARNAALNAARGEFVTFIDSDDYIARDLVEQLLVTYRYFGGGIPVCTVTREPEKLRLGICGEGVVLTPQEAMRELTLIKEETPRFEGWSVGKLFERSLFSEIRFPEGISIGEDLAVMYRLFDRAGKIVFVDTAKYFYYDNPCGAVNGDFSKKDLLGILEIWDSFYNFLKKKYPEIANFAKDRATMGAVCYYYQICLSGYKEKNIRSKLRKRIRRDMPGLLYRKHPFFYKWRAVLIAFCPMISKMVFVAFSRWYRLWQFTKKEGNTNVDS